MMSPFRMNWYFKDTETSTTELFIYKMCFNIVTLLIPFIHYTNKKNLINCARVVFPERCKNFSTQKAEDKMLATKMDHKEEEKRPAWSRAMAKTPSLNEYYSYNNIMLFCFLKSMCRAFFYMLCMSINMCRSIGSWRFQGRKAFAVLNLDENIGCLLGEFGLFKKLNSSLNHWRQNLKDSNKLCG